MASYHPKFHLLEDLMGNADLMPDIFNSIQDGISILDTHLNIITVNHTMEKWYAHAAPLAGKKCHEAYHGRREPCPVCPSRKTLETGKTRREIVPRVGPGKRVTGWFDLYSYPLVDRKTGKLKGVIEHVRDITDQKRAEDALHESESRYKQIFNGAPFAIFQSRPDGQILDVNPECARLFGYASREQLLKGIRNARSLWVRPEKRRPIVRSLPSQSAFEVEFRRAGGSTFLGLLRLNVMPDASGKSKVLEGFIEDITERKQNEAFLRESEERYRKVVEQSWQGTLIAQGPPFRLVFANPRAAEILGYSVEELMGLASDDLLQLVHPDELSEALQRYNDILKKEMLLTPREFRLTRKDGSACWAEILGRPVLYRGEPSLHIAMIDVTERKKAENDLRRELEIIAALSLIYTPVAMPSNSIKEIARAVLEEGKMLTGSSHGYVSEIDPKTQDNVAHTLTSMIRFQCRMAARDRKIIFPVGKDGLYPGLWGHALNTKKGFFTNDPASHPASRGVPDKHVRFKTFLSVPVLVEETLVGQIALANSSRNFDEKDVRIVQRLAEFYALAIQRIRAQLAIEESEANFSALAQNANDAILITVDGHSHEYANRQAEALTGYTMAELLKMGSSTLIAAEEKRNEGSTGRQRAGREKQLRQYETELLRKNGSAVHVEVSVSKTVWRGKSADLVFIRDITERRAMEEQIRQDIREKEVLLKEVHHRVKNNMQIISSLLNLQSQYVKDEATLELFRESQNRIRSMALIHERLYQSGNLAEVAFNEYVQNLAFHLFRTFGIAKGKVDLRIDIRNVSLEVGTAIPCGLIINELVSNALKYAFPPGRVRRRTNRITVSVRRLPPGRTVLRVADNGIGLPKNAVAEPGRSLGLRIVKALVSQMEAALEVKTDRGTSFSITFKE